MANVSTPAPIVRTVQAPSVRRGQASQRELTVVYQHNGPHGLPVVSILSDWRKGRFQANDGYSIEQIETPMDGLAFKLIKFDERHFTDGTEPAGHYHTFIAANDQDHICECRGFEARG